MIKFIYYIRHPRYIIVAFLERCGGWIPDKLYLYIIYYLHTGRILHLNPPSTFCEKIQWLKLHDINPLYSQLVDKYEVKKYVSNIIGNEYIIPTYGVWENTDDIDFNCLPQQFVLKTTHDGGGGGVFICDKNKLDIKNLKTRLNKSLKHNIYKTLREKPYKEVKPRIIAEKTLKPKAGGGLTDYKFFCFNGEPKFCQVKGHEHGINTIDIFDLQWKLMPFTALNPKQKNAEVRPKKPANYERMIELARKLCGISDFMRVDFYNIDGIIYFGEITFYPASGMGEFTPEKFDYIYGKELKI